MPEVIETTSLVGYETRSQNGDIVFSEAEFRKGLLKKFYENIGPYPGEIENLRRELDLAEAAL